MMVGLNGHPKSAVARSLPLPLWQDILYHVDG
jgi:hypothetical protein